MPQGDATAPAQRVLRTVYLPAANADALQLKVESLQAQLTEQKQLASERVAALMQDRTLREQVRTQQWELVASSCAFHTLMPRAQRCGPAALIEACPPA